ncbi:porin, partial [Pseudomonas aeruginosa]
PGLRIAVGILDPIDSNQIDKDASDGLDDKAYQDNPRYESEVSYQFDLAGA